MPLRQKLCLPTSHSSSTNSRVFQAEPIRALLYRLAPALPSGPCRTRRIAYPIIAEFDTWPKTRSSTVLRGSGPTFIAFFADTP